MKEKERSRVEGIRLGSICEAQLSCTVETAEGSILEVYNEDAEFIWFGTTVYLLGRI